MRACKPRLAASGSTLAAVRPANTGFRSRLYRFARDQLARVAIRAIDHPRLRHGITLLMVRASRVALHHLGPGAWQGLTPKWLHRRTFQPLAEAM